MSHQSAQAIVVTAPHTFSLTEVKLRELKPDEVLVKTCYTSISAGTERLLMTGDLVEMAGLPFPCIPGYETVGQIIEVGENVPSNYKGEWAFIGGSYGYEGVTPAWGGQSSLISADYRKAFLIGDIDPVQAVAIAPAATSFHGIALMDPQPGQLVLVLGQGPIGQLAAQFARLKGATVAVSDTVQARLDLNPNADFKINVAEASLKDKLPGKVDILVDATGKMDVLSSAFMSMKERGKVCLLGFYRKIELPFAWPFINELSFHVSREWGADDIPSVINSLGKGEVNTGYLFTHRFPVAQYREAYKAALEDPACLKALVEWD